MPKHPIRKLLLGNLQRQFSSWKPGGSSEASWKQEVTGVTGVTWKQSLFLGSFKVFYLEHQWHLRHALLQLWVVLPTSEPTNLMFLLPRKVFPPPYSISINQTKYLTRNKFLQTIFKWTHFNLILFCQDLSVTFIWFTEAINSLSLSVQITTQYLSVQVSTADLPCLIIYLWSCQEKYQRSFVPSRQDVWDQENE